MRVLSRVAALAVLGLAALPFVPGSAAAATPAVHSVVEGRDTGSGRPVLVLLGSSLNACKSCALTDAGGTPLGEATVQMKSKTMLVLGLPEGVPAGSYRLLLGYGNGLTQEHPFVLANGAPLPGTVQETALSSSLKDDLDDAATLGGRTPSWYTDASNLSTGTLPTDCYSAWDDLAAEDRVGPSDGQVAAGKHNHDARYYTRAEVDGGQSGLGSTGTINDGSNPVAWSRLKGVPAGFADGTDNDTTYSAALNGGLSLSGTALSVLFAGSGNAASAARSDHDHNSTYFTQSQLSATGGTVNAASNPVDWSRLKGVPAGLADGTDNDAWTTSGSNVYRSGGKVGIGTTTPTATLEVSGEDGVVFKGSYGYGSIPATGWGVRMMWYPKKAAFRTGYIDSWQWDDSSIGEISLAAGYNCVASGGYSTAVGYGCLASGVASTALGSQADASGFNSVALGASTKALGNTSTAMGVGTTAIGQFSTAMGCYTYAAGSSATATGYITTANGDYSTTMGFVTQSQDYASVVMGRYNVLSTGSATAWNGGDTVLVVGNGSSSVARSNAFTLLKNGNLTIAGSLTQNSDLRLKTDVLPLGATLAKIATLHGVSYRFKDGGSHPCSRQVGLVAQEVREVFPELVQEGADGTLSVAYGNLSAVLVEAVKEQQAVIEKQRSALEALEARLAKLEAGLSAGRSPAR